MALPPDKPPSYEEATGQSLSPTNQTAISPTFSTENEHSNHIAPGSTSLPAIDNSNALDLWQGTTTSLPAACTSSPISSSEKKEKEAASSGSRGTDENLPEALVLAKAYEAANGDGQSKSLPPIGWSVNKAPGDKVSEAQASGTSSNKTPNLTEPVSARHTGDKLPSASGTAWPRGASTEASNLMTAALHPPGLEPLLNLSMLVLRETFIPTERGDAKRGAIVLSAAAGQNASQAHPLLLLQRGANVRGSSGGGHGRHRHPRVIELLDASGSQVIGRLESTKRSRALVVDVMCPPGSRIARIETHRMESVSGNTPATKMSAIVSSASEQVIFRLEIPVLGALETQPIQEIMSAVDGSRVGLIEWAWSTEADVTEARLRCPGDLDARMKMALIALCLLLMEAFGRRWSTGKDTEKLVESLKHLSHLPTSRRKRH